MKTRKEKDEPSGIGPTLGVSDISRKRELWKAIAKEMNGEFHILQTKSHEIEMHRITIPYHDRVIEISVSDTKPLKFSILFHSRQVFNFDMGPEDLFEKIRKKFGVKDVEFGMPEFDRRYMITSGQPHVVKEILTREVREILLKYPIFSLSFQSEANTHEAELCAIIQKTPGSKEMMLELIRAFQIMTDHLQQARIVN